MTKNTHPQHDADINALWSLPESEDGRPSVLIEEEIVPVEDLIEDTSLVLSLGELMKLHDARCERDEVSAREAEEARVEAELARERAEEAEADRRVKAALEAHRAERQSKREAEARLAGIRAGAALEARIHAESQNTLCERELQYANEARAEGQRQRRHKLMLGRLLTAAALCVGLGATGGVWALADSTDTSARHLAALRAEASGIEQEAAEAVERLSRRLEQTTGLAAEEQSRLRSELADARQALAEAKAHAEEVAARKARPAPKPPTRLVSRPALPSPGRVVPARVAVDEPAETCLPFDPMCFEL